MILSHKNDEQFKGEGALKDLVSLQEVISGLSASHCNAMRAETVQILNKSKY